MCPASRRVSTQITGVDPHVLSLFRCRGTQSNLGWCNVWNHPWSSTKSQVVSAQVLGYYFLYYAVPCISKRRAVSTPYCCQLTCVLRRLQQASYDAVQVSVASLFAFATLQGRAILPLAILQTHYAACCNNSNTDTDQAPLQLQQQPNGVKCRKCHVDCHVCTSMASISHNFVTSSITGGSITANTTAQSKSRSCILTDPYLGTPGPERHCLHLTGVVPV